MKKFLKWTLKTLGALVALLVIAGLVGLGWRAYRQHQTAQLLEIHAPNAIDEARFVKIGGVDEWMQIRGENRDNPVILFLHGGPGFTAIPYFQKIMRSWETDFTIVHWDQRGAGKSYARNGRSNQPRPTLDQMVSDGIEVAEYARTHLNKPKTILIGYSWGSVLGLEMARARPDLFYAFVGTGQVMDTAESELAGYRWRTCASACRGRPGIDSDTRGNRLSRLTGACRSSARQRGILEKYRPAGEIGLDQFKTLLDGAGLLAARRGGRLHVRAGADA